MLEDRQGSGQVCTGLRDVALLLIQPAIAGVSERQLVLGADLLESGDTYLEVGRC